MINSRGSIWKKCDFHIHTPFSALGNDFGNDFDTYVKQLFTKALDKKIHVIGITDYFTIEGYKKIKLDYLEKEDKLKELFTSDQISKIKKILVLPNIEFRLNKIVQVNKIKDGKTTKTENGRINFHVLFSDELPINLIEESFLHDLDFIYESDPNEIDKRKKLKTQNLAALGKRLRNEQEELRGSDLQIGMVHAVVDDEKINEILTTNKDFKDKYLMVIPADEDLSEIKWLSQDSLVRKILISRSHALFSANENTIKFGLGEKSASYDSHIKEFKSLKPSIWGSDAHDYNKLFEPDEEKYCWIKANTTFEGIRQILFEPKDRCYIGKYPDLFSKIKASKNTYIDKLTINQISGYDERKGIWFKDFELNFGLELIAIIGNKGKGKSGIADILGLLGNASLNSKDFSFLNPNKFCQKGYSENFNATLKWYDGTETTKNLSDRTDPNSIERVKYIPQSYLEKLCNDENSGFNEEINKVVFSRLDDSDKLGKKSFAELQNFKTEIINQSIEELVLKLHAKNREIRDLEFKASDDYKSSIENKKNAKVQELDFHEKEKSNIKLIQNPNENPDITQDQRLKADEVTKLNKTIIEEEAKIEELSNELSTLKIKASELENIILDLKNNQTKFFEWKSELALRASKFNLDIDTLVHIKISPKSAEDVLAIINNKIKSLLPQLSNDHSSDNLNINLSKIINVESLKRQKVLLEKELEKPFKDYQEYVEKMKLWEIQKKNIVGDTDTDNTITYYNKILTYLEKDLLIELNVEMENRVSITTRIYSLKMQVQEMYNKMKIAISDILKEYSEEQNITIETSFKIDKSFYTRFFDYVNRYSVFYQNADDELRKIVNKFDFDDINQVSHFVNHFSKIDIRFKDDRKVDFYDYICSLSYLNPEYDLQLNKKPLNQLSPGEKGGLLLVFYLVLDKDNKPLIIDQPEDNLDNQSVAEILVPYIKRAKKNRQIFMVTHNPNLAIVADAEQIIYMDIDKENNYKVTYDSGGIEDKLINNHIVNILEGKMKAFDNRRVKYAKPDYMPII